MKKIFQPPQKSFQPPQELFSISNFHHHCQHATVVIESRSLCNSVFVTYNRHTTSDDIPHFLAHLPSVRQKFTISKDNLKSDHEPKNEDETKNKNNSKMILKIKTTPNMKMNPKTKKNEDESKIKTALKMKMISRILFFIQTKTIFVKLQS